MATAPIDGVRFSTKFNGREDCGNMTENHCYTKFGESKLEEFLPVLDEYGTEAHAREVNRVKLAILQLSEGNREKLLYWTKTAKVDYRDPLAAQEPGSRSPEDGAKLQGEARRGEARRRI